MRGVFPNVRLGIQNWEGKTPLHVAAEFGALGFSISLIEAGCHAGEECSAVDKRLVDPPNESTHYWKVVNFAAVMMDASSSPTLSTTETGSSERARDARAQRKTLVEFLLSRPDALPTQESALVDLREKIYRFVPQLMPQLIGKMDTTWSMDDCAEAKQLYRKVRHAWCSPSEAASQFIYLPQTVVSRVFVHRESNRSTQQRRLRNPGTPGRSVRDCTAQNLPRVGAIGVASAQPILRQRVPHRKHWRYSSPSCCSTRTLDRIGRAPVFAE
jgi:hypothetical protein